MPYADIAEQLPAGVDVDLITQHIPLRSTRPSDLGELHLVVHNGALLVLSRRSAIKPMEPVELDLAYPLELVRDDRFAHGLRLVTADGRTHTLRINAQEREEATKLLRPSAGKTGDLTVRARETSTRLPLAKKPTNGAPPTRETLPPVSSSTETPAREIALKSTESVFIAVPWGRPTIDLVNSIQQGVESLAKRTGKPVALLLVVLQETRVPEDKTRRAARTMFASLGEHLAAMAVVFDGTGFAVAAKRSIFSLVSSKLLGSIDRKVFKDTETASAWLVETARSQGFPCPPAASLRDSVQEEIEHIRATRGAGE